MNGAVVSAVVSVAAYTAMQVVFKRAVGVHPFALTAWVGGLLPVWAGLLLLGLDSHLLLFDFSWAYVGWAALWALLAAGSTGLLFFLIGRLALTELAAYRKVFALLFTLGADVVLSGDVFGLPKLAVMGMILVGSVLLSGERQGRGAFPWRDVAVVALLCAVMTAQLYAYKQALMLQTDVLSHIFFAKALFAVFSLGMFVVPEVRKGGAQVGVGLMAMVAGLFFVGSVAEGFALQGLPMSVVVAVGLGMAGVFAAHDLWHGDVPRTSRALAGVGLVVVGLVALFYVT